MIPIRQDIEVLPADEPTQKDVHGGIVITSKGKVIKRGIIGFWVKETIGIAIVNPRGIKRGSISTVIK